jgi:Putative Flp pilus-assembly TadE/G-like
VKPRDRFARGQTMVVMTMVVGVLLGAMALGTDVGLFYYNWMLLQKAADSAALAGASSLTALADPSGDVAATAVSTAKGYACLNGINDPNNANTTICPDPIQNASYVDQVASTDVDGNDTQLSITLKRQVPYFFGKILGLNKGSVAASATAQVSQGVSSFKSAMFPAAIQCDQPCNSTTDLDPGQSVTFGAQLSGSGLDAKNWQWLNLGQDTDQASLSDAIGNGVPGTYSIGGDLTSALTSTDYTKSVVRDGFNSRRNAHNSRFPGVDPSDICTGGGNPGNIPLGDPLLVTIPVVNFGDCPSNCTVAIEGFAQIYLTDMNVKKGTAQIEGCFVQAVAPGSIGSTSAPVLGALSPPILVH